MSVIRATAGKDMFNRLRVAALPRHVCGFVDFGTLVTGASQLSVISAFFNLELFGLFLTAPKALALPHNVWALLAEADTACPSSLRGNVGKFCAIVAVERLLIVPLASQSSSSMTVYPPAPLRAPVLY